MPAPREPYSAAVTPDGKTLFAADLLPHDPADAGNVAAVIAAVDTTTNRATIIRLPNGSIDVRGLCVSPDGKYVYAVHILARYQLPTTQVDRGWVNTNALSIIDARAKKLINTVLLDDVFRGAADPWGVASTADGKWICVTHAGTHELSVIDAPGLIEKLAKLGSLRRAAADAANAGAATTSSPAANVRNDLAFLGDLRHRVKLEGNGPHGVAIIGSNAYIAEYFSDTVAVVDLRVEPAKTPPGGSCSARNRRSATRRRGEMLFNDATICFQHWQSCASCHPDGADGRPVLGLAERRARQSEESPFVGGGLRARRRHVVGRAEVGEGGGSRGPPLRHVRGATGRGRPGDR